MTSVRFFEVVTSGRIESHAAEPQMSSHQLTIEKRVPWGALAWSLPLLYVFWDPYQQRAGWFEWAVTALTLVTVLALFLAAVTYAEHRRPMARICGVLLIIAIGSLAYNPGGGIYFPVMANFVAYALGG